MFRKIFAMMLSATVLLTAFGLQSTRAQGLADTRATEKIRSNVQKIGVGGNARVDVKLRDNTQLKGYISDASEDSFTIVDNKTGSRNTVLYANASSVKKTSRGVSTKTWLIVGAAAIGAVVTWIIVKPVLCDGGAQSRGPC